MIFYFFYVKKYILSISQNVHSLYAPPDDIRKIFSSFNIQLHFQKIKKNFDNFTMINKLSDHNFSHLNLIKDKGNEI